MFKKLIEKVKQKQVDHMNEMQDRIKKIGDPLAESVEWSPLKGGGTNFRTHNLFIDIYRAVYKPSKRAFLFAFVFILFGAGMPGWIIFENMSQGNLLLQAENLLVAAFGIIFLAVGLFMMKRFTLPISFDKHIGYFWKGRKEPEMYGRNNPKGSVRLSDIHALQLVAERVKGDNSTYFSHEINLVKKDGSRVNVIDHGDPKSIYDDAEKLSQFLDVPVWDLNSISKFT
jgi:hypothetical protein